MQCVQVSELVCETHCSQCRIQTCNPDHLTTEGRGSTVVVFFFTLTQHDQSRRPLFIPRRVGGVLAGVAAGVGHFQVRDSNGRVLQGVVQENHPVLERHVGETLSIYGVVDGDVVALSIGRFPDPRHLRTQSDVSGFSFTSG